MAPSVIVLTDKISYLRAFRRIEFIISFKKKNFDISGRRKKGRCEGREEIAISNKAEERGVEGKKPEEAEGGRSILPYMSSFCPIFYFNVQRCAQFEGQVQSMYKCRKTKTNSGYLETFGIFLGCFVGKPPNNKKAYLEGGK